MLKQAAKFCAAFWGVGLAPNFAYELLLKGEYVQPQKTPPAVAIRS